MSWVSARRLALLLADGGGHLGASGRIAVFDVDSKRLRNLLPLLPIGSGITVAGKGSLAPSAYRFRWSVEDGRTYLWAIVRTAEDISVRRFAFDPEDGVTGPGEVIVSGTATRMLESLGVARDGSALTYSQTASVRTQIIQVDGLGDLDHP